MNISELVTNAKTAAGKQLDEVSDRKATALIRRAFAEITKAIEGGGSEPVRIQGLGVFRTAMIEREKDGNLTTTKRTVFRPAPSKE